MSLVKPTKLHPSPQNSTPAQSTPNVGCRDGGDVCDQVCGPGEGHALLLGLPDDLAGPLPDAAAGGDGLHPVPGGHPRVGHGQGRQGDTALPPYASLPQSSWAIIFPPHPSPTNSLLLISSHIIPPPPLDSTAGSPFQ